jgi:hypothetical protein
VSFNIHKNKQQLYVGCDDGSLRCYPLEKQAPFQNGSTRLDASEQSSETMPFIFQWEETESCGTSAKQFKHDTIGTTKQEYPLWITVVDLPGDACSSAQYLVCYTEEGIH